MREDNNLSQEVLLKKAMEFHKKGNIREATNCYKKFIEMGFIDPRVFSNLGVIYKDLGRLDEAEDLTRKAIQLDPKYTIAFTNLGNVLISMGKYEEAEKYTHQAIQLNPKYDVPYSNLGLIFIALEKFKDSEEALRKAIELNPKNTNTYANLGIVLIKLEKFKEAESIIRTAINITPNSANLNFQLGMILSKQNDFVGALAETKKAIKKDPDNYIYQGELTRLRFIQEEINKNFQKVTTTHLYSENDSYYLEDNKQDSLIIIFASNGVSEDLVPPFNFVNLLKGIKSFNKLFLRDFKCNYYMDGLGNTAKDFYETIEFIRNNISERKYKNVYAIGSSSGGFAAILFGNLLKFKKVLAFNPQTVLTEERELVIQDNYLDLRACNELRKKKKEDDYFNKCLNLKNLIPFQTQVEIHYSELSKIEKNYAEFIKHKNCKLINYKTSTHLLAYELREEGKLKNIILNFLNSN